MDPGEPRPPRRRPRARVHPQPDPRPPHPARPGAGAVRSGRPTRPDPKAAGGRPGPRGGGPGQPRRPGAGRVPRFRARPARDSGTAGHRRRGHHARGPRGRSARRADRDPHPGALRLSPSPERVVRAGAETIARLGIVASRARSLVALAEAERSGRLGLDGGAPHDPEEAMRRLAELPGVGPWTAHYIAMRALRWPDAFPKEDLAVRGALGGVTAEEAEARSQAWRPWRSYAVLYLWRMPRPITAHPAAAPRTRTRRRASALGAAP